MKALPPLLAAHYETGSTTLARIWTCTRRDGQIFGFTDHDAALVVGAVNYQPRSGFTASALKTAADFSVDNLDLDGLLESDAITSEDIEAGLWDGATIELAEVNWADVTMGKNVLRYGSIGEIQHEGPLYKAELRGLLHKLQNNIGRIASTSCDALLGDARCKVDLEALRDSGVVTSVADLRSFTASALAGSADYYAFGEVLWTSGANVEARMEVSTHATGGVLELVLEMPHEIEVGDAFTIVPGCDRSKSTCIAKYDNLVNFRGFSFIPGQDKTLLVGGQ